MRSKFLTTSVLVIVLTIFCVLTSECRYKSKPRIGETIKAATFNYKIDTTGDRLKGYILTAPFKLLEWNKGGLVIMDMQGRIILDKPMSGTIYDFRQWRLNGKTYYSYMINDTTAYHIKRIALTAGYGVLLDEKLNELKQIHLLPHDDIVVDHKQALDMHDLIMISENHYIALAAYEKKVTNIPDSLHPKPESKIAADIIQEVVDGKVVWQWDASHYPEFYSTSTEKNNFGFLAMTQDYLHINSMTIDTRDSNLICSFRSTDQVCKINRRSGEIMWRLGGKNSDFPLPDSLVFQRQHHVTVAASWIFPFDKQSMMSSQAYPATDIQMLTLVDNGDSIKRKTSRILTFMLDEKHKKVIRAYPFSIPAPYNRYMGSVMIKKGHYFIGGGTGKYILEIDPLTGKKYFELTSDRLSYRDYWVESVYGLDR